MTTPRCFIIRHGETEWSLSGKHTGNSDIPLTANGEKRVRATGKALVGDDRLIVPKQLKHIYVSPMHRSQRTMELLDLGSPPPYPWQDASSAPPSNGTFPNTGRYTDAKITVTDKIREWDYGDYEGITSKEIKKQRADAGMSTWDIWRDGCPGGESPDDVIKRVDELISEIRTQHHEPYIGQEAQEGEDQCSGDVVVVAHGHILRAFAMRWIGKPLSETRFIMEAGGVGTLSYEHKNIDEPAILLGGGFVVGKDVAKEIEEEEKEGKLK